MQVFWQSGHMWASNFLLKININVLFTLLCGETWYNTEAELKIVQVCPKLWGNNCFPRIFEFLNILSCNSILAELFHKSFHRRLAQVVVFLWAWKSFPYVGWVFQEMRTDNPRLSVSSNWCAKNLFTSVEISFYNFRMESDGKLYVKYEVIGKNHVSVPTHFFKVHGHLISICYVNSPGPCWMYSNLYLNLWRI